MPSGNMNKPTSRKKKNNKFPIKRPEVAKKKPAKSSSNGMKTLAKTKPRTSKA